MKFAEIGKGMKKLFGGEMEREELADITGELSL